MITYKYCAQCKSELNISGTYPKCENCGAVYYKNSKPTSGILPVKDGKVLLSKRAIEPFKGAFDVIGGFLENGEHPTDGVIREAKEETGLDIKPKEILGIYIDTYGKGGDFTLNIHSIGEIVGGDMKPMDDVSSLHWIKIEDVPDDEGFENTKMVLKDLKKWHALSKENL